MQANPSGNSLKNSVGCSKIIVMDSQKRVEFLARIWYHIVMGMKTIGKVSYSKKTMLRRNQSDHE
jgi:hypothetical protein